MRNFINLQSMLLISMLYFFPEAAISQTVRSDDSPPVAINIKDDKLNLSITIPADWSEQDSAHNHPDSTIIKTYFKNDQNIKIVLSINVVELSQADTVHESEVERIISGPDILAFLSEDGTMLSRNVTLVDGKRFGMMEFHNDGNSYIRGNVVVSVIDHTIISFTSAAVGTPEIRAFVDDRYEIHKTEIQNILNSIKFY